LEIHVEHLEYTYSQGTCLQHTALSNVNFVLPPGRVLGILGGTGSGKTTLIKILNGLLVPTGGRVLLDGRDTRSFGPGLRTRVGVVFQRPERQLFEETVFKDISFVLRRFSGLSEQDIRNRVNEVCGLLSLNIDRIAHRRPRDLSDGEKRKAAIAGILVNEPEVLVLDEPAVGLDPPSLADLIRTLQSLMTSDRRSILIASHDMEPFLALLDLLLVLDRGGVAAFGTPSDVCSQLRDDPALRPLLPELALLTEDLRRSGCAIPPNEFRIPVLVDELERLFGREGGAS
jgi:energy-coupling factor transport system ATP-binding protein